MNYGEMPKTDLPAVLDFTWPGFFLHIRITMIKPRVTMMTQKTTTTIAKSTTCNTSDSGSGTVVTVGVGARVTVMVVRRSVGKLEGGSIEPLLPSVARFGVVVPTVLEVSLAILIQLGTLVDCGPSGQVEALRAPVYSDCTARNSLLLGVSSVPFDKLP